MGEAKEIIVKLDIETVARLESAIAVRAKVWAEAARAVSAEANEVLCQAINEARAVRDNACPDDPRVIFEKAEDAARTIRMEASLAKLWDEKDKGK